MKKRKQIILISLVTLCILLGGWIYYFYIATVNDYFLVKFIPPQKERSILGTVQYSKPKVKVDQVFYENDETAVEKETEVAVHSYERRLARYEQELQNPSYSEPWAEEVMLQVRREALEEMRYLIRVTHTRSFGAQQGLEMIIEHWPDKSLKEAMESEKIEVEIFNIYEI